jgi:ABC-type uncharacterized transport system ATPase subunit
MSLVEIKRLTKKFGNFTALDNVDLTMNEGEIFGFIGPISSTYLLSLKIGPILFIIPPSLNPVN